MSTTSRPASNSATGSVKKINSVDKNRYTYARDCDRLLFGYGCIDAALKEIYMIKKRDIGPHVYAEMPFSTSAVPEGNFLHNSEYRKLNLQGNFSIPKGLVYESDYRKLIKDCRDLIDTNFINWKKWKESAIQWSSDVSIKKINVVVTLCREYVPNTYSLGSAFKEWFTGNVSNPRLGTMKFAIYENMYCERRNSDAKNSGERWVPHYAFWELFDPKFLDIKRLENLPDEPNLDNIAKTHKEISDLLKLEAPQTALEHAIASSNDANGLFKMGITNTELLVVVPRDINNLDTVQLSNFMGLNFDAISPADSRFSGRLFKHYFCTDDAYFENMEPENQDKIDAFNSDYIDIIHKYGGKGKYKDIIDKQEKVKKTKVTQSPKRTTFDIYTSPSVVLDLVTKGQDKRAFLDKITILHIAPERDLKAIKDELHTLPNVMVDFSLARHFKFRNHSGFNLNNKIEKQYSSGPWIHTDIAYCVIPENSKQKTPGVKMGVGVGMGLPDLVVSEVPLEMGSSGSDDMSGFILNHSELVIQKERNLLDFALELNYRDSILKRNEKEYNPFKIIHSREQEPISLSFVGNYTSKGKCVIIESSKHDGVENVYFDTYLKKEFLGKVNEDADDIRNTTQLGMALGRFGYFIGNERGEKRVNSTLRIFFFSKVDEFFISTLDSHTSLFRNVGVNIDKYDLIVAYGKANKMPATELIDLIEKQCTGEPNLSEKIMNRLTRLDFFSDVLEGDSYPCKVISGAMHIQNVPLYIRLRQEPQDYDSDLVIERRLMDEFDIVKGNDSIWAKRFPQKIASENPPFPLIRVAAFGIRPRRSLKERLEIIEKFGISPEVLKVDDHSGESIEMLKSGSASENPGINKFIKITSGNGVNIGISDYPEEADMALVEIVGTCTSFSVRSAQVLENFLEKKVSHLVLIFENERHMNAFRDLQSTIDYLKRGKIGDSLYVIMAFFRDYAGPEYKRNNLILHERANTEPEKWILGMPSDVFIVGMGKLGVASLCFDFGRMKPRVAKYLAMDPVNVNDEAVRKYNLESTQNEIKIIKILEQSLVKANGGGNYSAKSLDPSELIHRQGKFLCFTINYFPHGSLMGLIRGSVMEKFRRIHEFKDSDIKNAGFEFFSTCLSPVVNTLFVQLKELYRLKILHCDIKPDNIMLVMDENGKRIERAVIIDFGDSRILKEDEYCIKVDNQDVKPTTMYYPHEGVSFEDDGTVSGIKISPSSEIYAFFVTLVELFVRNLDPLPKTTVFYSEDVKGKMEAETNNRKIHASLRYAIKMWKDFYEAKIKSDNKNENPNLAFTFNIIELVLNVIEDCYKGDLATPSEDGAVVKNKDIFNERIADTVFQITLPPSFFY